MKKVFVPLFSMMLVLSLFLGSFATAKAAPGDPPTVTPVSGDTDLSTEIVAIPALPGITTLSGGMLAPVGFPAGEAQFGGNGIRVTGMDSGKATACFYLSAAAINQGWGGKVGVWTGAKWLLLPTTITLPEETNNAIACATISGNGTYAFIKYVAEPAKLPVLALPECGESTYAGPLNLIFGETSATMSQAFVNYETLLPLSTPVSFQILQQDPAGFFHSGTSGTGIVTFYQLGFGGTLYLHRVTFTPAIEFTYDNYEDMNSFVFRVILPTCYADFVYPDDMP